MGGCAMKSPDLFACILVREFPAQAVLRMRPEWRDRPFVVLEGDAPLESVCALNTKARLAGLRRGMTRVEVETFEGIPVHRKSSGAELAAKAALLECAAVHSPGVEVIDEPNSFLCCLDMSGTESLFGPPDAIASMLRMRIASLGLSAQVTLTSDFFTAVLLARGLGFRRAISVIRAGALPEALASLPISVLDLSEAQAETLELWGIRNLGMLAALPRTKLIARMGQEGLRLQQLATGTCPHLFQPMDVPMVLEERVELDHPLDNLESLLFGVAIMLEQLIVRAALRVYALASVTIELQLEGDAIHTRRVSPRVPTNDKHLWLKLLHADLEMHPAGAPIVAVTVHAEPGATTKVQMGLFSPQVPEPGRLDVTLARIEAIVGEGNVGRAVLNDTHALADFHLEPFAVPSGSSTTRPTAHGFGCLRRVDPPEVLLMTLRNGKPASYVFRGRRFDVQQAYGPWLAGGEWWSERTWGQEQWDVIGSGDGESTLYACVIRDFVTKNWCLVGLYD